MKNWNKLKYLIMDVDGTMTNGKIYMSNTGEAMKAFNIKDGCGIHNILIPSGILPVIITGRKSEIVTNRCKELGIIHIYQGISDKVSKMREIISDLSTVAYIGDDINDIPAMRIVQAAGGIVGCPSDAVKQVISLADFVADHKGGEGAVRDFIEYIIELTKHS